MSRTNHFIRYPLFLAIFFCICYPLVVGNGCGPIDLLQEEKKSEGLVIVDAAGGGTDTKTTTDSIAPVDDATPDGSVVKDEAHTDEAHADETHGDKDPHSHYNCVPIDCVSPPASTCLSTTKIRKFAAKGACHPVDDKCVYTSTDSACNGVCKNGQCLKKDDPCATITCNTPTAPTCTNGTTLRSYAKTGTCTNKACTYKHTDTKCAHGCKTGKCLPDPCAGVKCTKPPASKCTNGTTLRNYYNPGKCGGGKCTYSFSEQKCPRGCANGKCNVGQGFSPVNPFRFLDTRGSAIPGADSIRCVQITGKGGVPASARAVYINVTAVAPTNNGFLSVYPKGIAVPNTSTLNYTKSENTANGAIVKLGTGGQVCIFVKVPTHTIIDVYGYFDSDSDFFPKGPYRRLDTRNGTKPGNQSTQCHKIAGRDGIPSDAKAVFLNLAIVSPTGPGFVTVYPKGISKPITSNLNYHATTSAIAGGSIVEVGTGGEVCVYLHASAQLIIDVSGYFGNSSSFVPVTPKRTLDTRKGSQPGAKATKCYQVAGVNGIPANARAIAYNVTAISPTGAGFLQVYPNGVPNPGTTIINYQAGYAKANNALVRPGTGGKICVYNLVAAHYVLDVVGYWQSTGTGNPCAGITCKNPPPTICIGGNTVVSYTSAGTCNNGVCVYTPKNQTCSYRCENAKCVPKPPPPPPPTPTYSYHPVTSWQTSQDPVKSGSYMNLKSLRYITIHYNGGNYDPDGRDNIYQDSDFVQYLQNSQRSYVVSRGYSLGYNSAIAPDGDEWEIRGLRYRAASNGCGKVNSPSYTIQVPTRTIHAAPTLAQVKGVIQAIARVRAAARAAGNTNFLGINGHRDVRPQCGNGGTACPGTPIYNLIKNGTIK